MHTFPRQFSEANTASVLIQPTADSLHRARLMFDLIIKGKEESQAAASRALCIPQHARSLARSHLSFFFPLLRSSARPALQGLI